MTIFETTNKRKIMWVKKLKLGPTNLISYHVKIWNIWKIKRRWEQNNGRDLSGLVTKIALLVSFHIHDFSLIGDSNMINLLIKFYFLPLFFFPYVVGNITTALLHIGNLSTGFLLLVTCFIVKDWLIGPSLNLFTCLIFLLVMISI